MPHFEKNGANRENEAFWQDCIRDLGNAKSPQSPPSPHNGANLHGGNRLKTQRQEWGKHEKNAANGGDSQNRRMPQTVKKT